MDMRLRSVTTIDSCFACDYIASDPYLKLAHELLRLLEKDELRLIHAVQRKKVRVELECAVLAYGLQKRNSLMNWVFKALVLAEAPIEIRFAVLARNKLYFDIHSALFLDIADRLEDETYIWKHVIGTDPRRGLGRIDVPMILLESSYLGSWQRFLIILTSIAQNFPDHSITDIWASCPMLGRYFKPSAANDRVREVIQKRVQPDARRTIDDLRKLYRSIPILDEDTGAPDHEKRFSPASVLT